jgi:hypothetical protein
MEHAVKRRDFLLSTAAAVVAPALPSEVTATTFAAPVPKGLTYIWLMNGRVVGHGPTWTLTEDGTGEMLVTCGFEEDTPCT